MIRFENTFHVVVTDFDKFQLCKIIVQLEVISDTALNNAFATITQITPELPDKFDSIEEAQMMGVITGTAENDLDSIVLSNFIAYSPRVKLQGHLFPINAENARKFSFDQLKKLDMFTLVKSEI